MNSLDRLPIPLLSWYNENKRELPWRNHPTAYQVWVSEIMLQQTRVSAVIGYYQRFLETFPTISALAAAPEEVLLKCWQGLGYYSRARNLQKAAKVIVRDYNGQFPEDYDAIRALPGIGDYTAGAISSIAFGLPKPAVDGNVLRVITRMTGDHSDISQPATKKQITGQLAEIIPLNSPGAFNQALMELGATVCLPNGAPLCNRCPARDLCLAHTRDLTHDLPVKAPKRPRRIENRQVYLIFHNNCVALRRRPPKGLLANLWEFPHTLEGETLEIPLENAEFCNTSKHIFTHIEWHMKGYTAHLQAPQLPSGWVWAGRDELVTKYAIPSAFSAFLPIVLNILP